MIKVTDFNSAVKIDNVSTQKDIILLSAPAPEQTTIYFQLAKEPSTKEKTKALEIIKKFFEGYKSSN